MTTQPRLIDDDEADPKTREYWLALGRFIEVFSMAEHTMNFALRKFAKLRSTTATVLLSGTRIDAAGQQIKRIAEAEDWPKEKRARLDTLLTQLGVITQTRNDLLHYGWMRDGHGYQVSNVLHAHIPKRIRVTRIDLNALDAMSIDLLTIIVQIERLQGAKLPPEIISDAAMPPERAWLYKSEVSQGPGGTPQKHTRKH